MWRRSRVVMSMVMQLRRWRRIDSLRLLWYNMMNFLVSINGSGYSMLKKEEGKRKIILKELDIILKSR